MLCRFVVGMPSEVVCDRDLVRDLIGRPVILGLPLKDVCAGSRYDRRGAFSSSETPPKMRAGKVHSGGRRETLFSHGKRNPESHKH